MHATSLNTFFMPCWAIPRLPVLTRRCQRVAICRVTGVESSTLPRIRELGRESGRGRSGGPELHAEVERLAKDLEADASGRPLSDSLVSKLNGVWYLLYKGGKPRNEGSLQSRSIRAAGKGKGQGGSVMQVIDVKKMRAENKADFRVLGVRVGVRVTARLTKREDEETLDVRFRNAFFKLAFLPAIPFPLGLFGAKGWLRTTYLSENCRVGRGDKGSLFILAKEQ